MSGKRVLLSCTVVSVRDYSFVYPSCRECVCRLTQEDQNRYKCPKCGVTCHAQNVDYRYRLSLNVTRDTSLFGVTVFGSCLNPFFGVTASGLQRFVETERINWPNSLHQMLNKAVEDCFIGKCFIFGFKLSSHDTKSCLFGGHISSVGTESAQFVACQVLPLHGALRGVTVFAYLQILMQANAQPWSPTKAVSQLQQKDSLVSSFDDTLPLSVSSDLDGCVGLTPLHPWQTMPGLVLCSSPVENGTQSLHQLSAECMLSQHVPKCESSLVSREPERADSVHQIRPSTLHESSLSSVAIQFHSPALLPGLNSTSTTNERQSCSHWLSLSRDCNASYNSRTSSPFALEDAPLSETLGDFVNLEPHISEGLFLKIPCGTSKPTAQETAGVMPEIMEFQNETLGTQSMASYQPMRVPLCNITNMRKRKFITPCVSDSITDMFSKRNSSTKNPVCERGWFQRDQISFNCQSGNIQERTLESHENEYNCSADLFHHNCVDIKMSEESQSSVTYKDKQQKDSCVLDNNALVPEGSLLQFAPSLQSTPIADPYLKRPYGQRCELNKKWLQSSKKEMTYKNVRGMKDQSNVAQCREMEKSEFDSSLENSESLAGDFEMVDEVQHVSSATVNEWSRDLFDCSF